MVQYDLGMSASLALNSAQSIGAWIAEQLAGPAADVSHMLRVVAYRDPGQARQRWLSWLAPSIRLKLMAAHLPQGPMRCPLLPWRHRGLSTASPSAWQASKRQPE